MRTASNWLMVDPAASANDTTLAVMGPQLGYYYPEIVQQIHLSAPGIEAQGAAVPGLSMYLLLGRTEDYAWSLTSANQDVRDVFAEILCEPDGSAPTRESSHYEFDGECVPFEEFDAGTLGDQPIRYPVSVHGPVIGTATSEGVPVALTSQRSTFGRDGLNLGALKNMTEGEGDTPETFFETANQFGFTFNWGYANRDGIGYFAVRLAARARRRPRPPPADPRHRRLRVAGLPRAGRAPARHRAPDRPPAQLEQPVGARLHARRQQPVRLGASRRGVRPVAGRGGAHRRRRRS